MSISQSVEGLNRKGKEKILSLCPIDWVGTWICSCLGAGIDTIGTLASQASDSGWNLTTGFPGSPTGKQQIMALLRFHYCVSQFLITNVLVDRWIDADTDISVSTGIYICICVDVLKIDIPKVLFIHVFTLCELRSKSSVSSLWLDLLQKNDYVFVPWTEGGSNSPEEATESHTIFPPAWQQDLRRASWSLLHCQDQVCRLL